MDHWRAAGCAPPAGVNERLREVEPPGEELDDASDNPVVCEKARP